MNWWKDEAYENIIGPYNLQNLVNQLAAKYKTNIVASKIDSRYQMPDDKYTVEVWYNFESRCYIINIYYTEQIEVANE